MTSDPVIATGLFKAGDLETHYVRTSVPEGFDVWSSGNGLWFEPWGPDSWRLTMHLPPEGEKLREDRLFGLFTALLKSGRTNVMVKMPDRLKGVAKSAHTSRGVGRDSLYIVVYGDCVVVSTDDFS